MGLENEKKAEHYPRAFLEPIDHIALWQFYPERKTFSARHAYRDRLWDVQIEYLSLSEHQEALAKLEAEIEEHKKNYHELDVELSTTIHKWKVAEAENERLLAAIANAKFLLNHRNVDGASDVLRDALGGE